MPKRDLWLCPECGRGFANVNQSHACGRHELESHFTGRSPEVRRIYELFVAMLESFGSVTVLPEKSRIAFQVRMSFAQLTVRRTWVTGHFVLARRLDHPLFAPGRDAVAAQPRPPFSPGRGGGRGCATAVRRGSL